MQTSMFESALDQKFNQFHAHNPKVYELLVKLARQAKGRGKSKIGIGMLFEVVRWEMYLSTTDADYKVNNSYRSRYSRLIMSRESDLQDIFETRELKS